MKNFLFTLFAAAILFLSSCSGKKADQENADSTYQYPDTSKLDSTATDTTPMFADSTTNAPADAKH
ncbi:hypothetical protein [Pedobacter frigidisoli]|uniref:hypothetical protein n=1 Tax=Pedobacter frigidisoli TaxID=2530455 RepID=UPI00292EA25E|nr:hypothetical protein [Pedobacter frigidisoli]